MLNNKYKFLKLFNKRKKTNDTKLSKIFNNFKLEIKKQKGLKIKSFQELNKFFETRNFSSKIQFSNFQNLNFEIEFPINHINISSKEQEWQVEIGPILFPLINNQNNKINLFSSFLMYNKFYFVDVFYDYPFGFRNKKNSDVRKFINFFKGHRLSKT